jgi:hypothetical protein
LISANATYKLAITDVECDTQSTIAGAYLVVLTDGASNTMARLGLPDVGDGSAHETHFQIPPRTSATNSAVTMTVTGSVTVACTANYFTTAD